MNGVPDRGIAVRRDPLPAFLRAVADAQTDPAPPRGLCLLSGSVTRRNLADRLAADGVGGVARTTTVEGLATDLVEAEVGQVEVLDRPMRRAAVGSVLASADEGALGRFADRVADESDPDGVTAAFEEYLRCTDATRDHDDLVSVVDAVADDHPFAATTTRESAQTFHELDGRLRELVEERDDARRWFVSRSHLVRAAREHLPGAWSAATDDPDWVAVATVSVLDNPTLRLLVAVARETPVFVFAGPGTAEPFADRIAAATELPVERPGPPDREGTRGRLLSAAVEGEGVAAPPAIRRVAAPDRRREVEAAVRAAEGSTLVVAPDASDYRTPLRDVALTRDCPFRVETRRELRNTAAFRGVAAVLELVAAAAADEVRPRQVVAPLRLGVPLPPATDPGDLSSPAGWPIPGETVRTLASVLGTAGAAKSLAAWRATVDRSGEDLPGVDPALSWVEDRRGSPPEDGEALRSLVERVVEGHSVALRERAPRRPGGAGTDAGRALVATDHPATQCARVRDAAGGAAGAYDWLTGVLDRPAGWETALVALRKGGGTASYGPGRDDAAAIEVVDAGNAYFRRADHVVVLGLAAGEFPRPPRQPAFLHRRVRDAVRRRRETLPYLYLDSEATGYARDLDAYGAALRAARDRVTLVSPYRDDRGRTLTASPFLDGVEVAPDRRTRIDPGEWPAFDGDAPTGGERLRALVSGPSRPDGPVPDRLESMAGGIDAASRERVKRRRDQFEEYRDED